VKEERRRERASYGESHHGFCYLTPSVDNYFKKIHEARQMNDHFTKGREMKAVLVIIAVLVFASAGTAAEYFKWIDERGVVHFTDTEARVPEERKDDVERRVMPEGRGAAPEGTQSSKGVTEEPRGRYGRGQEFWVNRTTEAKQRQYRAQRKYERLRMEYKKAADGWNTTTSLSKRDEYGKKMDSLEDELRRQREDINRARQMLEITLPEEAARAGVPAEWVQ
jgi:hypothetical protein